MNRWSVFTLSFTLALGPMLLWCLASPLGSVPDEPSHAIRAAAVVRGDFAPQPRDDLPTQARAEVPRAIAFMHERICYAFQPEVPASCVADFVGDPDQIVMTGTSAGTNHPLYYAIVGLPSLLLNGDAALYGMRALNAILCAAALAVAAVQLSLLRATRWTWIALFVAVTPMVLFLAGSINPNGLEVAASISLLSVLITTFRASFRKPGLWAQAALVTTSTLLLTSTRSITLLWVLIIVTVALLLGDRVILRRLLHRTAFWTCAAVSALICVAAVVWNLTLPAYAIQEFAGAGTSAREAFVTMLLRTFDFTDGYVGLFGWVDTPSPKFSVIVFSAAIVTLALSALALANRRTRFVIGGLIVVMLLVPAVTQAVLAPQLGYIWQGRYMLAMLACLLVVCGVALDDALGRHPLPRSLRNATAISLVLVAVAQTWSFWSTLKRYVVGSNGTIRDMLLSPAWQPPLGWFALTVLAAVAFAAAAAALYRCSVRVRQAALPMGMTSANAATTSSQA